MSTLNKKKKIVTHEGAIAKHINPELQLRRSVMACMLWEKSFYEDGQSIADRIEDSIKAIKNKDIVRDIAIEARETFKLRHVPLLLARILAKEGYPVKDLLERIIQRPDEITEFLAIYWKNGKEPLSNQVKKGLAKAFLKFNEYQLAKYNRDGEIKLRDALFLCHAKPENDDQEKLFKRLVEGKLEVPDTWEVALSSGADKCATWERLIIEKKLGGMALLRNLRNMKDEGVSTRLMRTALKEMDTSRILPFRFISAAMHAPYLEPELEEALFKCTKEISKIKGKTVFLVDVSYSMTLELSEKSSLNRLDAACALAMILREICEEVEIFSFSHKLVSVPPRRGFGLKDAIINSQDHNGTALGGAIKAILDSVHDMDRLIVMTDEQSEDKVPDPTCLSYMINVDTDKNGVGYGKWVHFDGWSESIIRYISEYEKETNGEFKNEH